MTLTRNTETGGQEGESELCQGCSIASLDTSGIDEAVQAAQQSDVAIVFVWVALVQLCTSQCRAFYQWRRYRLK